MVTTSSPHCFAVIGSDLKTPPGQDEIAGIGSMVKRVLERYFAVLLPFLERLSGIVGYPPHAMAARQFKGNKATLPSKPCAACGRTMSWRKKWRTNWADVQYCSERCRRHKGQTA